ncbi:PapB/FocB family fimbrial expression transcriptional regulator [Escherichia coli O8:H49]
MYLSSKAITKMSERYSYNCNLDVLLPGNVPEEQFWLLIDISPIHSEKVIIALLDYFVRGKSRKDICELHHINNGYLSTSIARLNQINYIAKQLASYYSNR